MARKTINVDTLKLHINNRLADTVFEGCLHAGHRPIVGSDFRKGLMNTLEMVLHETGNYKGFRYLGLDEVPKGHLPGIKRNHRDEPDWTDTDNTRVRYF